MSYSNYSLFDLKTVEDYTQEDVDKVSKLFKDKLSKLDLGLSNPDWFIKEIFNEEFDLDKGKIRIGGESERIKHSYAKEFGLMMEIFVDSFRECGYKLEVPPTDECPYWEVDNGPDENYIIRFELFISDDDGGVYIDEEGEEEEGDNYDEEDDWYDEDDD